MKKPAGRIVPSIIVAVLIWVAPSVANAQDEYRPDPAEVLRMIRAEKLDMILPSAMRDNGVDMWIH